MTEELRYRFTDCGEFRYLTNPYDLYVGKGLQLYGEWAAHEMDLLNQFLKPGHNVIEAGSNIGSHTVHIAKRVGPHGLVFAFEPQRLTYQLMVANIALNSLVNVFCLSAGFGAKEETINLLTPAPAQYKNFGLQPLTQSDEGEPVQIVTLDGMLANLPRIHLLKADVEGYENEMLAGAEQLIKRDRPLIYLENDREERSKELIERLWALDYDIWWHIAPAFKQENPARRCGTFMACLC